MYDVMLLSSGGRESGLDRGWAEKGATRLRSRGQPTRRVPWLGGVARPVTVGIGDGGNEIGMGSVRARIARLDALRARIATVVPVDHLVVAGVSNWGGSGSVAALARLPGGALLHAPA